MSQLLGSRLLQAQYGKCLLRRTDCLSQRDFRPADTHRNPGDDQLEHELAGVPTVIRQVLGKLDAEKAEAMSGVLSRIAKAANVCSPPCLKLEITEGTPCQYLKARPVVPRRGLNVEAKLFKIAALGYSSEARGNRREDRPSCCSVCEPSV